MERLYKVPARVVTFPVFGNLIMYTSQADHVGVVTAAYARNEPAPNVDRLAYDYPDIPRAELETVAARITIRGAEYGLRGHAFPVAHFPTDGDVRERIAAECDGWAFGWREPYLSRLDTYADATDAAIRKAREVLIAHIGPWLATDDGRAFLARGAHYAAHNRVARAEDKADEVAAALVDARRELVAARRELKRASANVGR